MTILRRWSFAVLIAFALSFVAFVGVVVAEAANISASIGLPGGVRRRIRPHLRRSLLRVDASRPVPSALACQEGLEPCDKTSRLDDRLRRCIFCPHLSSSDSSGSCTSSWGVHLRRSVAVVGTARGSELVMQWTLVRGQHPGEYPWTLPQ